MAISHSLIINPPAYGANRRDPNQFLREVLKECLVAEELGYESAWVPEHHFGLFGCLPSPAVFLSHVAAQTKHTKLAPATVLLPCHHPLRVAEEFALLDLLSQGRAVFSAGRGYDKREYDAFATPFEESRERFAEGLDLLRVAWTQEEFTYHGQFYSLPEPVTCLPRTVQQPHPPIYVACFSRPTVEMAAEKGFHTLFAPFAAAMMFGGVEEAVQTYQELAANAGHTDARAKCSYFVHVADTKAEEIRPKERLLRYLKSILPAFPADREKAPPHIAYFVDIVERLQNMQPDQVCERSLVTGDVDSCIATLKKCEAAGIEEVILYFNFGHFSHKETLRSMELFAREVMPHFC